MANTNAPLKLIGYWLGWLNNEDLLAPQEIVAPLSAELKEQIAAYLDSGVIVRSYRGGSWCRFYCGQDYNGSCERSDGEWVWPDGLAHYVREHSVRLPEAFIQTVLEGKPIDPAAKFKGDISDDWWKEWSRANMNPEFRAELERVRCIAEMRITEALSAKIAQLEMEIGVSNTDCTMARCASKALVGLAFCPRHFLGKADEADMACVELPHYRPRYFLTRWSNPALKQIDGTGSNDS